MQRLVDKLRYAAGSETIREVRMLVASVSRLMLQFLIVFTYYDRPYEDSVQRTPYNSADDTPHDSAQDTPYDTVGDTPYDSAKESPDDTAQDTH
ncbi:unnamed protein product [Toxocara canis]|uniref:Transmembrane protein n=1 Tax=Toxocara canis TaxID=6265 RepID=A0A183V3R1_TOXCA|nr:unnamed protein product [Toxocara canis]